MIKVEAEFDTNAIKVNGFLIHFFYPDVNWRVIHYNTNEVKTFSFLEQAIAYCSEQSNANPH